MHVVLLGGLDANARMQLEGRFTRTGRTNAALRFVRLKCEHEAVGRPDCPHPELMSHAMCYRRQTKRRRTAVASYDGGAVVDLSV